ncbi:MAG: hypothetical protein AAFX02_03775 [Pseudomonadota bacterium]
MVERTTEKTRVYERNRQEKGIKQIPIRLNQDELAALDKARGDESRPGFIKRVLLEALGYK